jgi:hypothetical protein
MFKNYFKNRKRKEYLRGYDYAVGVLIRNEKTLDELDAIDYDPINPTEFDKGIRDALIDFERKLGHLSKWKKLIEDTTIGMEIAQKRAEKLNKQNLELNIELEKLKKENLELNIQSEKLKIEFQGPDGFETWKEAALHERVMRVDLDKNTIKTKDNQIEDLVAIINRLIREIKNHNIDSKVVKNTLDYLNRKGFKPNFLR